MYEDAQACAIADLMRRVGRLEQVELPTPGSGSGIAPSGATYITQTPNSDLSAEQALSALATGYMKNTTTTGVVSIQATPIPAADTVAKVVSVSGTSSRISSTGGGTPVIDIDAAYVGQASITTLGTVTTGVWNGSVVIGAYGGTGINNGVNTLTFTGSGTLALGAFTGTLPATGTFALGTGAAGRVTYWSGTNTVTSDANFLWDSTNHTITAETAAAATTGHIKFGSVATGDYLDIFHATADRTSFFRYTAAGVCNFDWNPTASDGTGGQKFRLFRQSNSSGASDLSIFEGNNSANLNTLLSGNGSSYVGALYGNLGIRATTFGTGAVGVLGIKSGTPPSTSPADTIQLYSADTNGTAGKAGLHIRTEDGTSYVLGDLAGYGTLTPTAQHHFIGGTLGTEVYRWESPATNDDVRESGYQNRVATTNNTQTTLQTFTIPASTTMVIEAVVVARRTGGVAGTAEDGAGYVIRGTYKNVAGTATLIGALTVVYTAEDQAGWDATFTLSGATVLCRVTGATSNNIVFHMTAKSWQVGT